MDVKDLIKAKEDSVSVAYQTFALLTSNTPNALFCFFEGNDAPYYHLRIKFNYEGNFHYIKCGGKSKVIKVFELIKKHREYNKYKKAFFIDKDFDKSIKNRYKEIYETPCYSIENLYCAPESLAELLKTDFQLTENTEEFKKIVALYRKLILELLDSSLLFNAWYKLQKKKHESTNNPNNVSLPDTLIPEFIKVSLTKITTNYDINKILDRYPQSIPITKKELENEIEQLAKTDLHLSLRGKFIFNFLIIFIRLLLTDGGDKNKRTVLKRKVKYNIDNTTALTALTGYALTPDCLTKFIKQYN